MTKFALSTGRERERDDKVCTFHRGDGDEKVCVFHRQGEG